MSNRIGIEVDVKFPSKTELKAKLAQAWKGVKDDFQAKVNIDIDQNSLKQAKKKIERALQADTHTVKINTNIYDVLMDVNRLRAELKKLDSDVLKNRKIKIDIDQMDIQKAFKDVLKNYQLIEDATQKQKKNLQASTSEVKSLGKEYDKVVTKAKQLADGKLQTVQVKTTVDKGSGIKETITESSKGVAVEETRDRLSALKEIHQVMKDIHSYELKLINASKEEEKLLDNQIRNERELLAVLKDQYQATYKKGANDDGATKKLIAEQKVSEEMALQKQIAKELKKEQQELASAVSKVAQLEKTIGSLKAKAVGKSGEELDNLKQQISYHEKQRTAIHDKYNLSTKMTDAQKSELNNIREINRLQLQNAEAKQKAVKASEEERDNLRLLQNGLKEIHSLKIKIANLEEKGQKSAEDMARLNIMKEQLSVAERDHNKDLENLSVQNKITSEMQDQLSTQRKIYDNELDRVRASAKVTEEQRQMADKMRDYEQAIKNIGQLQRDLIFAGRRETEVIEEALSAEKQKADTLRTELRNAKLLTDAREDEIQAIQRAQQAQAKLNAKRQEARERDVEIDDSYGMLDAGTYFNQVEQGARAVIQPVLELEEALVGVRKVADGTDEVMQAFEDGIYDSAKALGVGADEYVLAVEKWVTAGKTISEAQELANVSLVGSFVGGISADDMVKYMSVPLNAFKNDALSAQDIINGMNETANNNAIEMNDLGKAYVRSAGTVKDMGATFGELTGFITAAQETTRKGGERVGTALKTMAINMGNINSQLTADAEKKFAWFEGIGVNFQDANGEMRTMTEILGDLKGKWSDLSAEEKSTAKFYLAGKEHAEVLTGVIDGWDTYLKVVQEVNGELGRGEEGSAYIEHAKQSDSLKFKLNELQMAWDKLMHTFAGGHEGVNSVFDILISGIEKVNELVTNPKFMEALKFLLVGIGAHATANTAKQIFDGLTTGAQKYLRGLEKVMDTTDDLIVKTKGLFSDDYDGNGSSKKKKGSNTKDSSSSGTTVVATGAKQATKDAKEVSKHSKDAQKNLKDTQDSAEKASDKSNTVIKSAGSAVGKTSKAVGTFGNLLRGVVGAVPLIGDAMLILELAGVPVFENVGKAINKMKDDTSEAETEMKKLNKAIEDNGKEVANNKVIDGYLSGVSNKIESMDEIVKGATDRAKKEKKSTTFTNEEFEALKETYNAQAQDLGLDLQITFNDYEDIMNKLEALKQKKIEIGKEETIKLVESNKELSKNTQKYADEYSEISDNVTGIEKTIKENDKKIKDLYDLGTTDAIKSAQLYEEQNAKLNKQLKESKKLLKESKSGWEESGKAMRTESHSVFNNLEEFDPVEAGLSSEETQEVIGGVVYEFSNLHKEMDELAKVKKKVSENKALTPQEYQLLKQAGVDVAGLSYATKEWGDEERKRVQESIDGKTKEKNATIEEKQAIVDHWLEVMGYPNEYKKTVRDAMDGNTDAIGEVIQSMGALGASMLGLPLGIYERHKDDFAEYAKTIEDGLDKIPTEKATKYRLINEDGSVNWEMIEKIETMPEEITTAFNLVQEDGSIDTEGIANFIEDVEKHPELVTKFKILKDGQLNPEGIQEFYKELEKYPEVKKLGIIKEDGSVDLDALMENLDQIPSDVKVKLGLMTEEDAKAEEMFEKAKNLPEEIKIAFGLSTGKLGYTPEEAKALLEEVEKTPDIEKYFDIEVGGELDPDALQSFYNKLMEYPDVVKKFNLVKEDGSFDWEAFRKAIDELPAEVKTELGITLSEEDKKLLENTPETLKNLGKEEIELKFGVEESGISTLNTILDGYNDLDFKMKIMAQVQGEEEASRLVGILEDIPLEQRVALLAELEGGSTLDEALEKLELFPTEQLTLVGIEVNGEEKPEELKKKIDELEGKTVTVESEVYGTKEVQVAKAEIKEVEGKRVAVITDTYGREHVVDLDKSIENVEGKDVDVNADTTGKDGVDKLNNSIEKTDDKDVKVTATTSGKDDVDALNKSVEKNDGKTFTATFKAALSGAWDTVREFFGGGSKKKGGKGSGSVASGSNSVSSNSVESSSSASISAKGNVQARGIGLGSNLITSGVSAMESASSMSKASTKKTSSKSSSTTTNNSRVSEDVWRYWKIEKSIEDVTAVISKLDNSITKAGENFTKVAQLLAQKEKELKKEQTYQNQLAKAKDTEINSVLNKLKGYGFKVNTSTNTISNLGHAKSFKGEKAETVEELLNKYKSLNSELTSIKSTIDDINAEIYNVQQQAKEAKISAELKKFEKQLKRVDALLTKVSNDDAIRGLRLDYIADADKELQLKTLEQNMNSAKSNMSSLITEFNKLSTAKVSYAENGEELLASLEDLGSAILEQADAIIEYQNAINTVEFERVTEDLDKFNDSIDANVDRTSDMIDNLKEGLLSGQKLSDLQSSESVGIDLSRKNQYEKEAEQRIALEQQVQKALDAYAKKNVDRATGVANATLQVNAKMYNQLLKMQKDYTAGTSTKASTLKANYGDLVNIATIDKDYANVSKKLEKYVEDVIKKQETLKKKYISAMNSANSQEKKDSLTNQFIIDNLKIQEEFFKAQINGANQAIKELESQLKDSTLDADTEADIKAQISEYEDLIIDAQNSIKDSVKDRFEFEFELMDEAVDKYQKLADELDYAKEILDLLGNENFSAYEVLYDAMLNTGKAENSQIQQSIADLKKKLALYEKGSLEWNLINEQLNEYKELLQESNKELLEMNQNILGNSFDATIKKIQQSLFDGKTLDEWKDYQDLWMDGLEKELALEKLYQRMADLGHSMSSDKMALLDKQEKISRFEMDYLEAQLDVLEAQQKLENLKNQRTVQTLKQNADGTWDYVYEANADDLSDAQTELEDAQLALEQLKDEAKESYIGKLETILDNAQSGRYNSVTELENAITDLGEAYKSILDDFPQIQDDYLKDLIEAYSKFIDENKNILEDVTLVPDAGENYSKDIVSSITSVNKELTNTFKNAGVELRSALQDIGAEMGETFARSLEQNMPTIFNASQSAKARSNSDAQSVTVQIDKVDFPNATNADEIKKAILQLPQIALQKSKSSL